MENHNEHSKSESSPPEMPRRIELLYNSTVSELTFLKKQQWAVTNYSLIAYGAIYAIARNSCHSGSFGFLILLLFGALFSTFCLIKFQRDLKPIRDRRAKIHRQYYSPSERGRGELNLEDTPRNWLAAPFFFIVLLFTNLVGALVVAYLLWPCFVVQIPNLSGHA